MALAEEERLRVEMFIVQFAHQYHPEEWDLLQTGSIARAQVLRHADDALYNDPIKQKDTRWRIVRTSPLWLHGMRRLIGKVKGDPQFREVAEDFCDQHRIEMKDVYEAIPYALVRETLSMEEAIRARSLTYTPDAEDLKRRVEGMVEAIVPKRRSGMAH